MVASAPVPYRQFLGHRARSAGAHTWADEDTSAPTSTAGAGLSAPAESAPSEPSGD